MSKVKTKPFVNTVERQMQQDMTDCTMEEFVRLIREVDGSTVRGVLGYLRVTYQQLEIALKDLREKIDKENSYTKEEGELHIDLAKKLVVLEEKARLASEELVARNKESLMN